MAQSEHLPIHRASTPILAAGRKRTEWPRCGRTRTGVARPKMAQIRLIITPRDLRRSQAPRDRRTPWLPYSHGIRHPVVTRNALWVRGFSPPVPVAARRRRLDCPFVFHRSGRRIRNHYGAWRKAAASVGTPKLYLHDSRRSAARNLVRAGVSERVAMTVTGHKTRSVFDRYNIVSEADLREASSRISVYLTEREQGEDGHSSGTVGRQVVALQEVAKP
jgi:hypothetical protein